MTRRAFLKAAGACAGAQVVWGGALASGAVQGRPQLGAIGVGGRGQYVVSALAGGDKADVVAICDVDEHNLEQAARLYPAARRYVDWRKLLEEEGDRIDHVCIATPDHSHAPAAISALRRGKHVFCEKPLAHDLHETRQMMLEARRAGVATQMGIQKHGHAAYRRAVRLLQDGVIGKVKECHSWCKAQYSRPGMARPASEDPVPSHLHWDLWLGVAPARPHKQDIYHPGRWRGWRDFGCGALGDFGCHIFDPVFTALGLGAPTTITAEAPEADREVWPCWSVVRYLFPGTALTAGETIQAVWYDGGKRPPPELVPLLAGETLPEDGSLLIGEDGVMLLPHCDEARLYPSERFTKYAMPDVGHLNLYAEWLDACRDHRATEAGFDYAGPLTEAVLLGTVALQLAGKTLEWDSAGLTVRNAPEANALLRHRYREGWEIPVLET